MNIEVEFGFGTSVMIDHDTSLVGVVTAVQLRTTREAIYEISYLHCGDAKCSWIEGWRLKRAEHLAS